MAGAGALDPGELHAAPVRPETDRCDDAVADLPGQPAKAYWSLGWILNPMADGSRVILPITDPYVVHHGALGSYATVYLDGAEIERARACLARVPGIDDIALKEPDVAQLRELYVRYEFNAALKELEKQVETGGVPEQPGAPAPGVTRDGVDDHRVVRLHQAPAHQRLEQGQRARGVAAGVADALRVGNAPGLGLLPLVTEFAQDKTVVLVTHRTSLLALVTRVIVIDGGKVVADGPRDRIMEALASGRVAKAA